MHRIGWSSCSNEVQKGQGGMDGGGVGLDSGIWVLIQREFGLAFVG